MIPFNVGDIFKSSEYDFLDGAKIKKISSTNIIVSNTNGRESTYSKESLSREIGDKNITIVSGKIENWKERLR